MTLRVSGKNLDIGESLRAHVASRLDAAAAKYAVGRLSGHVTIEPEGSGYRADCTLHLASGITLQVEAEAKEAYASFNRAADRIEKRLRRYRRRVRDHHASEAQDTALADVPRDAGEPEPEDTAEIEVGGDDAPVIAETCSDLAEMPVAAAVLELDRRCANIFLFRHPADGRLSLVYRRPDGLIGWMDRLPPGTVSPPSIEARIRPRNS